MTISSPVLASLSGSSADSKPWQEAATLRQYITAGDTNKSDGLDKAEFKAGLAGGVLRTEELRLALLEKSDLDQNGRVTPDEYGAMNAGLTAFFNKSAAVDAAGGRGPEITAGSLQNVLSASANAAQLQSRLGELFTRGTAVPGPNSSDDPHVDAGSDSLTLSQVSDPEAETVTDDELPSVVVDPDMETEPADEIISQVSGPDVETGPAGEAPPVIETPESETSHDCAVPPAITDGETDTLPSDEPASVVDSTETVDPVTQPDQAWQDITVADLDALIGKPAEAVVEELASAGVTTTKIITPDSANTEEFSEGRALILANADGNVTKIEIDGGASTTPLFIEPESVSEAYKKVTVADLDSLIGKSGEDVGKELTLLGLDVQQVPPNAAITADFVVGRTRIFVDADGNVASIIIEDGARSSSPGETALPTATEPYLPDEPVSETDKYVDEFRNWLNGTGDDDTARPTPGLDEKLAAWLNCTGADDTVNPTSDLDADLAAWLNGSGNSRLSADADPKISDTPTGVPAENTDETTSTNATTLEAPSMAPVTDEVTMPNPAAIFYLSDNVKVTLLELAELAQPTLEAESKVVDAIVLLLSALDADGDGIISPAEMEFGLSLTDLKLADIEFLAALVTPEQPQDASAV